MWAARQLNKYDYTSVIRDARDFALTNGLVLRYDDMHSDNQVAHIPFTLFPSPFPRKLYEHCLAIQPILNKLMVKVADDADYLDDILTPITKVDDFTRNLLQIEKSVRREGIAQPIQCCISRADYMLDKQPDSIELTTKQVEVNAIASSMSAHSRNTKSLQDYLISKYKLKTPDDATFPKNDSVNLVAQGLINAVKYYRGNSLNILLVAERRSMNFSDHMLIETTLSKLRPDIKIIRRSFSSLSTSLKLGPNKQLILDGAFEIAVVYFRYCYDPSNYDFEGAWNIRLLLEQSTAIKCPSINLHLSGAKKFQQVLNNQTQLEKYLTAGEAKSLVDVFCKFWSFQSGNYIDEESYKLATDPTMADKLVLKPQREGGGHNIFGSDIKPFVETIVQSDARSQYILMEYINAPREKNWLLLHNDDVDSDIARLDSCDHLISELGIFGSILAENKSSMLMNEGAGYLVRSKKHGTQEGGVATGYAGISNLILIDDQQYSEYYTGI